MTTFILFGIWVYCIWSAIEAYHDWKTLRREERDFELEFGKTMDQVRKERGIE